MKKPLLLVALLWLVICSLSAAVNGIFSMPVQILLENQKTTNLRQAVRNLSSAGYMVYHYNESYVLFGSDKQEIEGASFLSSKDTGNLYLISKLKHTSDLSPAGNVLLDMGNTVLLKSNYNEVELRSKITNPFTPLDLVPLNLASSTSVTDGIYETRTSIDELINQVSADSVLHFIQSLQNFQTRYAQASNRLAVATWIKDQFSRFGISNASLHNFQWQNTTQYNVVATITGSDFPDTYIIVGGHHDSITNDSPLTFAPGADDNASGTVAALEMARVMMATGFQPKCSIRFVTFAAEEFGLWGSKAYAQMALENDMDIRLMINHDMIANTNPSPNDMRVRLMPYDGFMQHTDHAAAIMTQYTDLEPVYGSLNLTASDSYSFWQRGFPVIYYFEYNFSQVYHSNNDIVANMNPIYCAEVIRASTATAASYANMPSAPSNLVAVDAGTGNSISLNWTGVTDPSFSHFKVYWGSEAGVYPNSVITTVPSFNISGLSEGQACFVGVSTFDDTNSESYLVYASATPRLIPLTPANFVDSPILDGINLSWTPNLEQDLNHYKLYRSMDPSIQGDLIATLATSVSNYTDANLAGSFAYYCYRLCAVDNANNQSAFTNVLKSRPVTLDAGILIVDETKNYAGNGSSPFQPTDSMVDSFYNNAMSHLNCSSIIDLEETEPLLRLADLGIYSSVLWHGNDYTEMTYPNEVKDVLRQYIQLGGNILFSVFHPSQAFEYNAGYPATFAPNTFIHEVLGISGVDYYTAARFKYALGGLDQDFVSISVDSLKIPVSFNGHLFHVEGLVPASGAETLYTYGSNYASSTTQGIQNGQVVGVLNSYGAGKAITLSFPMYYMDYALSLIVMEDAFSGVFNEEVSLDDNINPAVTSIYLAPNYPNPFASESRIPYKTNDLIHPIKVQIFNLKGQVVKSLFEGNPDKSNSLLWDGKDASGKAVANGVYYIKASQNGTVKTRKMVLVK